RGRRVGVDTIDQRALSPVQTQLRGVGGLEARRQLHAQVAARHAALLQQLARHLLDEVDRDAEGNAGVAVRRRGDGRVDANHLAVEVDQRPARRTRIDRRVGLQKSLMRMVEPRLTWPRSRALIMPCVTVWFRPNGEPNASTQLPTFILLLSPSVATG